MPVIVKHVAGKYRIVEADTGAIASSKHNKPIDGGGHEDENKAIRQAGHINKGIAAKESDVDSEDRSEDEDKG
mgnify:CR=1 FL=1